MEGAEKAKAKERTMEPVAVAVAKGALRAVDVDECLGYRPHRR